MDVAIREWHDKEMRVEELVGGESLMTSHSGDHVVPVRLADLTRIMEDMGRMQQQMREQMALLTAEQNSKHRPQAPAHRGGGADAVTPTDGGDQPT